ncbi:MAG: nucleoside/nucleotide kinase family protein [Actinomycetales bacterium]
MIQAEPVAGMPALLARARALITPGCRRVLGIAGSPGAGKTTLATKVVDELNCENGSPLAVHLPMDGFHLANATLDHLGRRDRKGALDTFDGWGFVAILHRIRSEYANPVYAPSFRRTVDEPIAAEIEVPAGTDLVVVEGNYLLVQDEPWNQVRQALDESWFCVTPAAERTARLVQRHIRHGRSAAAAADWARTVDGRNAVLIESTRSHADLLVSGL